MGRPNLTVDLDVVGAAANRDRKSQQERKQPTMDLLTAINESA